MCGKVEGEKFLSSQMVFPLIPLFLTTALGTFHTAIGLVALPGGYIAGLLWDKIGPGATFTYGFTLAIISIALFMFVKPTNRARS